MFERGYILEVCNKMYLKLMIFSENPIQPDPESQDNCPVSQWQPWDCEGKCVDGKREGYRRVDRFHIVNGVIVNDVSIYLLRHLH